MLEERTYNTWKEICETMGWKTTGGTYKEEKLGELHGICKYHKKGRAFIIEKVYEDVLPSLSNDEVGKNIELLLLNILYESGGKVFYMTNNNLMTLLNIINPNYNEYYNKRKELDMGIEYYSQVRSIVPKYKTIIRRLLRDLSDKKLITYNIVDTLCYNEEVCEYISENQVNKTMKKSFRRATAKESKLMLGIEREELSKLRYMSVEDLYDKPEEYALYITNVSNRLKEYNINYRQYSYEIIFNKEHIEEELIKKKYEVNEMKNILSNNICNSKEGLIEKFSIYHTLPYNNSYIDTCIDILNKICNQ